jgi:hypothetical protein
VGEFIIKRDGTAQGSPTVYRPRQTVQYRRPGGSLGFYYTTWQRLQSRLNLHRELERCRKHTLRLSPRTRDNDRMSGLTMTMTRCKAPILFCSTSRARNPCFYFEDRDSG